MVMGRETVLERDDLEVVLRGSLALVPPQEGMLCHTAPPHSSSRGLFQVLRK